MTNARRNKYLILSLNALLFEIQCKIMQMHLFELHMIIFLLTNGSLSSKYILPNSTGLSARAEADGCLI